MEWWLVFGLTLAALTGPVQPESKHIVQAEPAPVTTTYTSTAQPQSQGLSFASEEDISIGGWGVGDCVPISGRGCATIGEDDREFLLALAVYVRPEFHHDIILITACESEFNQFAENPNSSARGYLQFLEMWWGHATYGGDWTDPWFQAIMAQNLIDNGGLSHWECKP